MLYDEYAGTVDGLSEAEAAAASLGDAKWAILRNHGVFIIAKDIRQAHLRAITLEHRCRLAWQVEALGGAFRHLTQLRGAAMSELLLLREVFNLIVGGSGGRG